MNRPTITETVEDREFEGGRGSETGYRVYSIRSDRIATSGLSRLVVGDSPRSTRSDFDWNVVNSAIQARLSRLTEEVRRVLPDVACKSGSHRARHILLSSYQTYDHLDGNDFDPVYVGITITEQEGSIRVSGDISGEESGRIDFDEGCELFLPPDFELVLAGAIRVADRLSSQEQILIHAIRSPRSALSE